MSQLSIRADMWQDENVIEPAEKEMVTMKRLFFGLMTTVPVMAFSSSGGFAGELPKVGDAAPNFELAGSDGNTYKLADFAGKKAVVIAWFPKAFTGG